MLNAIETLPTPQFPGHIFVVSLDFDWSPDSAGVVASFDVEACELPPPTPGIVPVLRAMYLIPLDGSGEEKLVDGPTYSPAWSPSGRFIAYMAARPAPGGPPESAPIRLVDLTSRQVSDLTQGSDPAWQPQP